MSGIMKMSVLKSFFKGVIDLLTVGDNKLTPIQNSVCTPVAHEEQVLLFWRWDDGTEIFLGANAKSVNETWEECCKRLHKAYGHERTYVEMHDLAYGSMRVTLVSLPPRSSVDVYLCR